MVQFSKILRGRSSVWLERRPVTPEVASSSLVGPASSREGGFSDFAESLFLWCFFIVPYFIPYKLFVQSSSLFAKDFSMLVKHEVPQCGKVVRYENVYK